MNPSHTLQHLIAVCALTLAAVPPRVCGQSASQPIGTFEGHGDVGDTPKGGTAEYDSSKGEYRVTGGGANIWASADAFQYVWKRVSGNVAITADVKFIGTGAVAHRKAVLMIRQNLNPDSAYADVAVHGDGLTSLQYRPTARAVTAEVRSTATGPTHIRIERRGNQFTATVGEATTPLGPVSVDLQDPVYVGLGVCSHDANVLETAVFSNVKVDTLPAQARAPQYRSRVSIYDLRDKSVRVVYEADTVFEAPNWSPDGKYLLANSGGELYRIPVGGGSAEKQSVCAGLRCNNDHGFSPDGKMLAISASSPASRGSNVHVAALDGSGRRQLTTAAPTYFHSWSPDGKWLAVVAQRDDNFDLFRIPATGGDEQRLTSSPGYDDGPDYTADGKWIYFNSNRSGGWDIWRMPPDGAGANDAKAERVTSDDLEDWFPHPSPDGKWLVFLSFPKGTAGHNDKLDVQLRMVPLPKDNAGSTDIRVLAKIFGGQGTINVNSWAPDSTRFAFVQYEPLASK